MTVVALGGQTGGGARLLGPAIAQALGANYVDRLILQAAAQHLGQLCQHCTRRKSVYPPEARGSAGSSKASWNVQLWRMEV